MSELTFSSAPSRACRAATAWKHRHRPGKAFAVTSTRQWPSQFVARTPAFYVRSWFHELKAGEFNAKRLYDSACAHRRNAARRNAARHRRSHQRQDARVIKIEPTAELRTHEST
eukprot:6173634-Pleurochrysis_carterae.AAC.1